MSHGAGAGGGGGGFLRTARQRQCLSHKGSGNTQGKGGVLATKAVETQGKGGALREVEELVFRQLVPQVNRQQVLGERQRKVKVRQ